MYFRLLKDDESIMLHPQTIVGELSQRCFRRHGTRFSRAEEYFHKLVRDYSSNHSPSSYNLYDPQLL